MSGTMPEIKISREGEAVVLRCPYHPALPDRAKSLGGRWDPAAKAWRFDPRDETRVRDLARAIFGTTGDDSPDLVTFRYTITSADSRRQEIWIAGRRVAWRPGRDVPVRLGDGVIIVDGGFPRRGGSARYPELGGESTVLEVRDAPRSVVPEGAEVVVATV